MSYWVLRQLLIEFFVLSKNSLKSIVMKSINVIILAFITLLILSFVSKPSKKAELKLGTYSVCNCDNNASAPNFGITFNEDKTFHYFDKSNKIDVKGNWMANKNSILLTDYSSNSSLDNKWTIVKTGKSIKSRKGLTFTRLSNLKECN